MNLYSHHHVAQNEKDAVRIALLATSIDMSMAVTETQFYDYALELVNEGIVPGSRINKSVECILTLKHRLGILSDV